MVQEIHLAQAEYPETLKSISDPPERLFIKGNYSKEIFNLCLGIVGSRKMTAYGSSVVKEIIQELSELPITIVSGFMYGIDIEAHRCALKHKLRTIAVLPCGIDRIYPYPHREIYQSIPESGGLLISEYPALTEAKKWSFPQRNRIIAGLCMGVLVVEGAVKSGSMITANLTRKYQRELFAVPGSIFSATSEGTNLLLKQDATLVTSAEDILEKLGLTALRKVSKRNKKNDMTEYENLVLVNLQSAPQTFDQLSVITSIPNEILITVLVEMELDKKIIYKGGVYHAS